MTSVPIALVTVDELTHYPKECELVNGEVRMMTPSGGQHGSVAARLTAALGSFVYEHALGEAFAAETGFVLARDPDTVRGPDLGFVANDRIPADGFTSFVGFAPDLAVEVLSPDDRPAMMREKIGHYLMAGTRLIWVVDPKKRTVTVHEAGHPPRVLAEDEWLDGRDVVPGFRYEISRMFVHLRHQGTAPRE